MTEREENKIRESFYNSPIFEYYKEKGAGKAAGYAMQQAYSKTKTGKAKLLAAAKLGTEKAAKLPTSKSKLQGARNGGKKVGGSIEGKKRMSEIGKKWASIYGFNQMTKKELQNIGIKYGKKNLLKEFICEKCGNIVNRGNYSQYHGDKCREADKIKLIKALPDKFTKTIVKTVAEKLGIKDWIKLNILHHTCPYVIMYIKVDKPNQYNPCWYKKNKKVINKK